MRGVAATSLVLLLLAGCTTPECFYEVRWDDPGMVDRLTLQEPAGQIPFDHQGLPSAFQGATVQSIKTESRRITVVADHDSLHVETPEDTDPAAALTQARDLLETLTTAPSAILDDILERLESSAQLVVYDHTPGTPPPPGAIWYETSLDVPWDIRTFLDSRFDEIPQETTLIVDDFQIQITPRIGNGDALGLPLTADGFGNVVLQVLLEPGTDPEPEAVLRDARTMLAQHAMEIPADAEMIRTGLGC